MANLQESIQALNEGKSLDSSNKEFKQAMVKIEKKMNTLHKDLQSVIKDIGKSGTSSSYFQRNRHFMEKAFNEIAKDFNLWV